MDLKELRVKEGPALKQLLAAERARLRELRFRLAASQLKDVRAVRTTRRTIARLLTIIKEKGIPL